MTASASTPAVNQNNQQMCPSFEEGSSVMPAAVKIQLVVSWDMESGVDATAASRSLPVR